MHPQMSHYTTIHRCSPAPFSPPPSPPKSEILSINKPHRYNSTEGSHEIYAHHQPSTPNLNYCTCSYNPSVMENSLPYNHSNKFHATQYHLNYDNGGQPYDENTTTCEQQPMTKNDKEEPVDKMRISFMLDNSCEEKEYSSNISSPLSNTESGKEIDRMVYAGRKRRSRKNPYPMRAPSKEAPGINLKVDVYTPVMKDPASILRSNDTSTTTSPTDSVCSQSTSLSSQFSTISLTEANKESKLASDEKLVVDPKIKEKMSTKRQRQKETRVKRSNVIKPERKRKGNSLARVMTDRGLLESIFNTDITSTDIKSVRIPPPPPMQHHELITVIKELNIDHSVLDDHTPDITWKGQPLNIAHLPHYKELHEIEAKVVSILRLTPIQYLTGKHTLVSASRRYVQRSLPFKKSDAQKLLRIDVNKASKLWEFFRQVKWI